jgi:hypothetical protein
MTGREDDAGRALRSLLLEESNAIPVDIHHAAVHLRRRLAHTRKRRRVTFAVAAAVVAAVAVTVTGGWLGVDRASEPAQNPDRSVAVAREFVDAIGRFDADTAISHLTTDADVQGDHIVAGSDAAEQLRLTLAHDRVLGYKQTIKDCVRVGISVAGWMVAGDSISCAFDMQAYRSDEIGLAPYTNNAWRITVRDGKIVWAHQDTTDGTNGFDDQMWIPFGIWMHEYHPDDILTMYTTENSWVPRYTEDSNRLWDQRTAEYVAAVTQNPAAYLDQPEVAAYAAKLDSICAAAQAKAKKETQTIPQQNQPAITEARERVMRETMPKLRAVQLPKAIHWPYEGRAFPLMEQYYGYPQNVQPPESLAHQIQQIPGLNKCIFPA